MVWAHATLIADPLYKPAGTEHKTPRTFYRKNVQVTSDLNFLSDPGTAAPGDSSEGVRRETLTAGTRTAHFFVTRGAGGGEHTGFARNSFLSVAHCFAASCSALVHWRSSSRELFFDYGRGLATLVYETIENKVSQSGIKPAVCQGT